MGYYDQSEKVETDLRKQEAFIKGIAQPKTIPTGKTSLKRKVGYTEEVSFTRARLAEMKTHGDEQEGGT